MTGNEAWATRHTSGGRRGMSIVGGEKGEMGVVLPWEVREIGNYPALNKYLLVAPTSVVPTA
jgi:hypothetical protein